MRKTKIICTLGPASSTYEQLKKMALAGMDVVRINMSHGTHAEHLEKINIVKKIREELNLPLPIMIDTKGPEVRIGNFKNGFTDIVDGQQFDFYMDNIVGDEHKVSVTYNGLYRDVKAGSNLLLNDGLMTFIIDSVDMDAKIIHTTSQCSGKLSNHKGMYCPGTTLSLPFLTDADKIDLQFAMDVNAEAVAASFVGSGDNMREIRDFFFTRGVKNICLISKIECQNGLDNIDGIIDESDGVMVARGDLGVEVPYEKLPALQKFLITSSRLKGKFVITATEMLESMISKPRPTRAEIIDVANAVYDGSSCVMLSAETAVGIDPANAIATMARIAVEAEKNTDYYEMYRTTPFKPLSNTDAISHAAVNTTFDIGAKAIVVYTASGVSARMISRFRPSCPIIACTSNPTVYHQLSLSWGVIPCMCESYKKAEAMFAHAASEAIKLGVAKADDTILITAGLPLGTGAGTNLIKIEEL